MARVHQAAIRTRHRVQIALASQPKDLDRKIWLTFGVLASRTRSCTSFSNQLTAAAVSLQPEIRIPAGYGRATKLRYFCHHASRE